MSWMSCTDDRCEIHKNEKEGAGYRPKDPKVRKQTKKIKRKSRIGLQHRIPPLRKARPRSPISPTSQIAYNPSA